MCQSFPENRSGTKIQKEIATIRMPTNGNLGASFRTIEDCEWQMHASATLNAGLPGYRRLHTELVDKPNANSGPALSRSEKVGVQQLHLNRSDTKLLGKLVVDSAAKRPGE